MNISSILGVAVLLLCMGSNPTHADETLKLRGVMHATFAQAQEVGDVEGHTAGVNRHSGIATLSDGTTGTCFLVAQTDYTKGAGTFTSYNNITLSDGSVLWYKSYGKTTVDGSTSLFDGTVTVIGGKGRFESAKGEGTFTGARLSPLAVGADLYIDWVINVKK